MKRNQKLAAGLLALASLTLSGCGGGGGGGSSTPAAPTPPPPPPPPPPAAEGFYQGTDSRGQVIDALVLNDGAFYALYGSVVNDELLIAGTVMGSGTSNTAAATYAGSGQDFYAGPAATSFPASLTASYVAGVSLTGTFTEQGATETFSATSGAATSYKYSTPASLSSLVGGWNGAILDGETTSFAITGSGSFSGTSSLGCSYSGTVAPRAGGKNVFDVTLVFGTAPCVLASQTVTGNAVVFPVSSSASELIIAVKNSSGTQGTVVTAFN